MLYNPCLFPFHSQWWITSNNIYNYSHSSVSLCGNRHLSQDQQESWVLNHLEQDSPSNTKIHQEPDHHHYNNLNIISSWIKGSVQILLRTSDPEVCTSYAFQQVVQGDCIRTITCFAVVLLVYCKIIWTADPTPTSLLTTPRDREWERKRNKIVNVHNTC